MFNAINNAFTFLGGNWFAFVIMLFIVGVILMVVSTTITKVFGYNYATIYANNALSAFSYSVMCNAIGYDTAGVVLVILQTISVSVQLKAYKAYRQFKAFEEQTEANFKNFDPATAC